MLNIVESGIKYHKPKPQTLELCEHMAIQCTCATDAESLETGRKIGWCDRTFTSLLLTTQECQPILKQLSI
jgi:hypothetical protein